LPAKSASEAEVCRRILAILDRLAPGRFGCGERKASGKSVIGKPADLQIFSAADVNWILVAVEVANVNTTQLVSEACRLFYDACPRKLMILGDRNVPPRGKEQCERVIARLYGQDRIEDTSARVVRFDDDDGLKAALSELLVLKGAISNL
jgi:hypothetical protein